MLFFSSTSCHTNSDTIKDLEPINMNDRQAYSTIGDDILGEKQQRKTISIFIPISMIILIRVLLFFFYLLFLYIFFCISNEKDMYILAEKRILYHEYSISAKRKDPSNSILCFSNCLFPTTIIIIIIVTGKRYVCCILSYLSIKYYR